MNRNRALCLIIGGLVVIALQSACSPTQVQLDSTATQVAAEQFAMATTAAPTATLAPTNTPEPTPTPVPTNTPTPEPTATSTPDIAATQAAEAAQAEEQAIALIEQDLEKIGLTMPPGSLGWVQSEAGLLEMSDYDTEYYESIDEHTVAKDFIFKTDINWESTGGLMTCGFYFRSESNFDVGKQYLFSMQRLSGRPSWRIAYLKDGRYQRNITGWRTAGAIDQDQGATNKLILQVIGGEYTLYINDQRIGTFYDYSVQNDEGYLAYYGYQESGESTCSFENSWIWLVDDASPTPAEPETSSNPPASASSGGMCITEKMGGLNGVRVTNNSGQDFSISLSCSGGPCKDKPDASYKCKFPTGNWFFYVWPGRYTITWKSCGVTRTFIHPLNGSWSISLNKCK